MSDDQIQIERDERVCAIVLRQEGETLSILALNHPSVGKSLMTDNPLEGEKPSATAVRVLAYEAGLSLNTPPLDLGKSKGILPGEDWHFFCCQVSSAPNEWTHLPADADKDGAPEENALFWQPLEDYLEEGQWHAVDIRAMRFAQNRFDKANETLKKKLLSANDEGLSATILKMVAERGADKSICPSEVARHIAGGDEKKWRAMMKPIRAEAVRLAKEGKVVITRKKVPVDPDNFKGVYRIGVANYD